MGGVVFGRCSRMSRVVWWCWPAGGGWGVARPGCRDAGERPWALGRWRVGSQHTLHVCRCIAPAGGVRPAPHVCAAATACSPQLVAASCLGRARCVAIIGCRRSRASCVVASKRAMAERRVREPSSATTETFSRGEYSSWATISFKVTPQPSPIVRPSLICRRTTSPAARPTCCAS